MSKTQVPGTASSLQAASSASPLQPHSFERRVLLMAVGLTPQVLTETLYALAVSAHEPWVPTEIHLITTAEGAHRAQLSLLEGSPTGGHFHHLCAEYGLQGISFDASHIHVVENEHQKPIQDMRTAQENTRAADEICARVSRFCNDPNASVHASIAGGRKTMGYYLGYALSLFGREQDRLSHVLVNAPFESLTDFFYPPQQPQVLHDREGRPIKTDSAEITLADIPFVRLRQGLPKDILSGGRTFAQAVSAANDQSQPYIEFNRDESSVIFGRDASAKAVKLPAWAWAWYALFCEARLKAWGEGQDGLLAGLKDLNTEILERNYGWVTNRGAGTKGFAAQLKRMVEKKQRGPMSTVITNINNILLAELGGQANIYQVASLNNSDDKRVKVNGLKHIRPDAIVMRFLR